MERSAETISRKKFCALPVRRRHALLAELARCAVDQKDMQRFLRRYDELQAWSELDRYTPPAWLSAQEALEEYQAFHEGLSLTKGSAAQHPDRTAPPAWQPRHCVEVVIDQVRSPYNVGSVLRLIDNFGFEGLVHASPWLRLDHPQLKKAARSAELWIPVRCENDLAGYLGNADRPVIGLENDTGAVSLNDWEPPPSCSIVLGNETYGIAQALRRCCVQTVRIPMLGYKKSMNVSHALAVLAGRIAEHTEST